jgi:glycosyltransferase involved in cell wall biosynthesis
MALKYVLITPAKNEEKYITFTIESLIKQTILPLKWIIVSDGSTDKTDSIVKHYLKKYSWIELLRIDTCSSREFASKVHTFNKGYDAVRKYKYGIIGNCDADISFENDFMAYILDKFEKDKQLGVAGTPFVEEKDDEKKIKITNPEHVSGACQIFRRECFEDIGGYLPIKGGGIDWVAVTTARMKGWKTRTFTEKTFFHHRKMGTENNTYLQARFKHGKKDYYLGGHPLWEIFRCVYQMTKKPILVGGISTMAGYFLSMSKRESKLIPEELIQFHRKEQLSRLKAMLNKKSFSGLS